MAVAEKRGAEAVVELFADRVIKTRVPKSYRIPELDERLRGERTRAEAKIMSEARRAGIPTPIVYDVRQYSLVMELIDGRPMKDVITPELSKAVGVLVGRLHKAGLIHGDLTTSNMILKGDAGEAGAAGKAGAAGIPCAAGKACAIYLIDFGLSFWDGTLEARGVDVHVYYQTLLSSHENHEALMEAFADGYRASFPEAAEDVLRRVREIEYRGRYKTETP